MLVKIMHTWQRLYIAVQSFKISHLKFFCKLGRKNKRVTIGVVCHGKGGPRSEREIISCMYRYNKYLLQAMRHELRVYALLYGIL